MNKLDKILNFLDKNTFITLKEGKGLGINPMMLSRLAAKEEIHRIEHGVYTKELDWLTDPLKKYIVACTRYPKAIICGISALTYYDLTDEEERQTWIALPSSQTINNKRYRIIRPSGIAYSLGIQKHAFGKRVVRIYDLEKSVVDAFKYLPIDVAHKALRGYLKRRDKDLDKLPRYGRQLRKPLDETIAIFLADQ